MQRMRRRRYAVVGDNHNLSHYALATASNLSVACRAHAWYDGDDNKMRQAQKRPAAMVGNMVEGRKERRP